MKLNIIKKNWEKYLIIVDEWPVDMILATIVGNAFIPGNSLWVILVAQSSGGKTTLLRPIESIPSVYFLDDLTENTFISGYRLKGKETSLLKIIGNGVMAFSDFTTILSKNPVSRGEILSQMRVIADGNMKKMTGQGSLPAWKGKIGMIGACTPSIYFHLEQGKSMGERFIYYWIDQPTDEQIAQKQSECYISAIDMQNVMAPMYLEYCLDMRNWIDQNGLPEFKLTQEQRLRINRASIFCVKAKATVHTNFKTGKVDQIPDQAGVGRDNGNFNTLLHTFQLMDCFENDDINTPISEDRIRLIEKCAYSSINRERRKILEILAVANTPLSTSKIGTLHDLNLEKEAVEMYLNPLYAVGIIKKHVDGNRGFRWSIEDEEVKKFIKSVAKNLPDEEKEIEEDDPLDDF